MAAILAASSAHLLISDNPNPIPIESVRVQAAPPETRLSPPHRPRHVEDINALISEHLFHHVIWWKSFRCVVAGGESRWDAPAYTREEPPDSLDYYDHYFDGPVKLQGEQVFKYRVIDLGPFSEKDKKPIFDTLHYPDKKLFNFHDEVYKAMMAEEKLHALGLGPLYVHFLMEEVSGEQDLFDLIHADSRQRALAVVKVIKHSLL